MAGPFGAQTGWGLAGGQMAAVLFGTLFFPSPLGDLVPGAVLPISVSVKRSGISFSFYCYHC